MENTKLEEMQNQPEEIRLNQKFLLFDPKITRQSKEKNGIGVYKSDLILDLGPDLPRLHTESAAEEYTIGRYKTETVTPFNPKIGYQITKEDFQLETRIAKLKRLNSIDKAPDKEEFVDDHKKVPLYLTVASNSKELLASGLIQDAGKNIYGLQTYNSTPEIIEAINRLRLQVFFPGSAYEAKVLLNSYKGFMYVREYYPLDTGPLSSTSERLIIPEGLGMFLPDDPKKLQQIWGKFILLKEAKAYGKKEGEYK